MIAIHERNEAYPVVCPLFSCFMGMMDKVMVYMLCRWLNGSVPVPRDNNF